MPIIRLFTTDPSVPCKQVVADTFESVVSKASAKLGFEVGKILVKENGAEIDEQDVFEELLKSATTGMNLLVLEKNEKFCGEGRHESNMETSSNECDDDEESDKGATSLMETERSSRVTEKPSRALQRERLEQLKLLKKMKEMEFSKTLEVEKKKKEELLRKFEELKKESTIRKTEAVTERRELEEKVEKLRLHNRRIDQLFRDLKNAEKVDICFLIDCTGSMSSYISEVKSVIHKVVNNLSSKFQDFALRFAFVGYRDHSDGAGRVVVFAFSEGADAFKTFVNSVSATGGADECEDVFGGLEEVTKLDWKNMSRVLFHIGDAPCHGSRFYVSANDSYPGGDPRGLNISDLMSQIARHNINYYFAQITESTTKMIEEFDLELRKYNGCSIKVVKLSGADCITDTVAESIATTIWDTKALSMSHAHGKAQKVKTIGKLSWDMSTFRKCKAELYKVRFDFDLGDLRTHEINYDKKPIEIFIAPEPFAKGSLRYAQAALVPEYGSKFAKSVIKESRFTDAKYNTLKHMKETLEPQIVSLFLANEFKKVSPSKKSIEVIEVNFIKLRDDGSFYSIEAYFDGVFNKWSNNAGFVNEEKYSATLDAFAHWTYQVTNEYLVVTDLQGCLESNKYTLTDPAITCPEDFDRFSLTNLGRKGLKKFFQSHQCNHICEKLALKKHEYQLREETRDVNPEMTQIKHIF